MQSGSLSSHTPSFNNYSSSNLSEIAARVIGEFEFDYEDFGICEEELDGNRGSSSGRMAAAEEEEVEDCNESSSEFSFANIGSEEASSLISADEIFSNGQIRPVFPVFDTELYLKNEEDHEIRSMITAAIGKPPVHPTKVRVPLGKLFTEEREASSSPSSSSSGEDELNGVPPETYCVWKPGKGEDEGQTERCKKSNSTGMTSSRRWRIRQLIRRSRSDGGGKENFGV